MPLSLDEKMSILELTARYNFAFDHQRPEEWADTFTEDGVFRVDNKVLCTGRSQLVGHIRMRVEQGRLVRHWTANPLIEGDGDQATLRMYMCAYSIADGLEAPYFMGEYDDRLRKVDGEWKFVIRDVTLVAGKASSMPS